MAAMAPAATPSSSSTASVSNAQVNQYPVASSSTTTPEKELRQLLKEANRTVEDVDVKAKSLGMETSTERPD